MNNRQLVRALVIGVLFLAGAAAIGIGAYNAGVAQGLAESGRLIAAPPAGAPYVYVSLLFLFLFFFVVRGMLWRGHWHGGWRYGGYDGVPPMFEEWHRRAHSRTSEPGSRASDPGMS
jgi:hypothetical protein